MAPINRDQITVNGGDPDTIPFQSPGPPAEPARRGRDYKREAPTGTSVSYMLRQLERGRAGKPARPDLLEKVKAGEMTPHAACVEAGYVPKAITVPAVPRDAARRLALHFDTAQIADLIEALNDILKARA